MVTQFSEGGHSLNGKDSLVLGRWTADLTDHDKNLIGFCAQEALQKAQFLPFAAMSMALSFGAPSFVPVSVLRLGMP